MGWIIFHLDMLFSNISHIVKHNIIYDDHNDDDDDDDDHHHHPHHHHGDGDSSGVDDDKDDDNNNDDDEFVEHDFHLENGSPAVGMYVVIDVHGCLIFILPDLLIQFCIGSLGFRFRLVQVHSDLLLLVKWSFPWPNSLCKCLMCQLICRAQCVTYIIM